jgi:hypothetical protein
MHKQQHEPTPRQIQKRRDLERAQARALKRQQPSQQVHGQLAWRKR